MDISTEYKHEPAFLRLPKELRLCIYEIVLKSHANEKVGNREINDRRLFEWPKQPGICRVCQLLRAETLNMYYSTAAFLLNIQRPSGEAMVLEWIDRLGSVNPDAFNKIQNVSIIAGLGYREPPKEYRIDLQNLQLVTATRPCAAAYLYIRPAHMRAWTPLACGAVKKRLRQLPGKDSLDFSVAQTLREVIAIVGELSGYGLHGDLPSTPNSTTPPEPNSTTHRIPNDSSPLLNLPKELRLSILEFALSTTKPMVIGPRAVLTHDQKPTDWSAYPGITRVCALLRREALPIYFASTHFIFNIQRSPCEDIVQDWISRCSRAYASAFQNLRLVAVIAGSGIRQPPRQYDFLVQQNRFVWWKDLPILQRYTLPKYRWSSPPLLEVRQRLGEMPKKGERGFDVAENLRGIIDVLARYSD